MRGAHRAIAQLDQLGSRCGHCPKRGALFETLIVAEFLKARWNTGFPANLFFWRDNVGLEVDLLLDEPKGLRPVEIKSSATVTDELFKGLRKWLSVAGAASQQPRLVCASPESYQRQGIDVRRWQEAVDGIQHRH